MYVYIYTHVYLLYHYYLFVRFYIWTILYDVYIIVYIRTLCIYNTYVHMLSERERESIWAYIEHTMGTEWAHRHHV